MVFLRWPRHVALIALVFVCACSLAFSYPAEQPQQRQSDSNQGDTDKPRTQTPINVTVTTPEKSAEEKRAEADRAQRQDATDDRIANATDRMAALTRSLVIVTVFQCLVTAFGFGVSVIATRAAKDSVGAARDSIKLARDNAEIALAQKRTGDQQLKTSKAIERAYIYVNHVISFEGYGDNCVAAFEVRNSGHTPGWIVRTGAGLIAVTDVTKHLPRPFPADAIGMRTNNQVVFAGQQTTFGNVFMTADAAALACVKTGECHLAVFGRIEYRDTFGEMHHTDFSFVWDRFKDGMNGPDDFHIHPDGYTDAT